LEPLLVTDNVSNSQNYTNLFPTFHTSYKVNDDLSLQLGYSRRIARPDGWDVNPFPSLANNLNLRTGNPDLMPEYTDSFEFSSIRDWDKASLNVTAYYAKTTDVVSRIVQVSDTLSISMPQNVGTIDNTGLEVNGQVEPVKWLSVSADLNWTYFKRFGVFESQEFNFDNQQWNGRLTTKLKLPKDLTAEFRLKHQSKVQRIQSESRERTFVDLGLRKKLAKGRAVINLSVRDVFSTRRFIDVADQPDFFSRNDRIRNGRQIVLGLSWGFGKGDAMEFSGHKQF